MAENISNGSEHEKGAIREQLSTVLESALFAHAERLGRFLKFVVDETLDGRADRLNQYAIALDVFDRDETFDPAIDAIVRVEAGRLRSKLLEYYDELGRATRSASSCQNEAMPQLFGTNPVATTQDQLRRRSSFFLATT